MINLKKILKRRSLTYALTGLSPHEFRLLSKKFRSVIASKKEGDKDAEKQLDTPAERLFFVLFYYTVHPTQSLMRTLFGYGARGTKTRLEDTKPVAEDILKKKLRLPKHQVKNLKDLYSEFSVPKNIFTLGIPRQTHKGDEHEPEAQTVETPSEPSETKESPKKKEVAPPETIKEIIPPVKIPLIPAHLESDTKPEAPKPSAPPAHSKAPLPERESVSFEDVKKAAEQRIKEQREQEARIQELIKKEVADHMESVKDSAPKYMPPPSPPPSIPAPTPQATEHKTSEPPSGFFHSQPKTPAATPTQKPATEDLYKKPSEEPEKEAPRPEWVAKLESKMTKTNPDEIIGQRQGNGESTHLEIKEMEKNVSQKLSGIKDIINRQLQKPSDELSIIELVDAIIQEGFYSRASDIHIEPEDKDVIVRLRIDGMLHDVVIYPKLIHSAVITRIKVLSGLRTDEHQAAQDGRFKTMIPDAGYIDVRVSIAPTYYGENSVMRVLTQQKELSLEETGLVGTELKKVINAIERPYGMILACGPTGSGKTSSLYAILRILNTRDVSIITIEDPIEYSMKGVDQIQVNAKTGLTFANGLRALLRQDPDIMMVGEIRDEETARIAVNAALTGHLLLSTIHTNDAATALPRLVDMNVEPFLVASTVNVVIGQRLIRRVCTNCKEEYVLNKDNLRELGILVNIEVLGGNTRFYRGKGCEMCDESGYKGRIGIFEVLEITENIKALVMSRASSDDIKYVAIKNGMITMLEDGMKKAAAGETTIEEVLRVARE